MTAQHPPRPERICQRAEPDPPATTPVVPDYAGNRAYLEAAQPAADTNYCEAMTITIGEIYQQYGDAGLKAVLNHFNVRRYETGKLETLYPVEAVAICDALNGIEVPAFYAGLTTPEFKEKCTVNVTIDLAILLKLTTP